MEDPRNRSNHESPLTIQIYDMYSLKNALVSFLVGKPKKNKGAARIFFRFGFTELS